MNDRQREKVRKLLALAESNNPHEAERARVQAKKIMAKYNITAEDSEIVEVMSGSVPRERLKDFEVHMVQCINRVSGCESFLKSRFENEKWRSYVIFVGLASDANMAAYCFDVLLSQLKRYQQDLKDNHGLPANKRNIASLSWVVSACEKLIAFFDYREVPDHVADYFTRAGEGMPTSKKRDTDLDPEDRLHQALVSHGDLHGSQARLNKATTHQKAESLE